MIATDNVKLPRIADLQEAIRARPFSKVPASAFTTAYLSFSSHLTPLILKTAGLPQTWPMLLNTISLETVGVNP